MDPKLKAILLRSQEIDKAARKYDTVDSTVLEGRVNNRSTTSSSSGGLYDQVEGGSQILPEVNVFSEEYQDRVDSSGLPPEIQRAMKDNPIPQPESGVGISASDIADFNPGGYSTEDEQESAPRRREPAKKVINESKSSINEYDIQQVVAKEIAKILPKVLENYFDKKIIKENTRLMKVLLKSTQNTKNRV